MVSRGLHRPSARSKQTKASARSSRYVKAVRIHYVDPGELTHLLVHSQYVHGLVMDLDRIRSYAEMAKKREQDKQRQAQIIQAAVHSTLFPHNTALQTAFDTIIA